MADHRYGPLQVLEIEGRTALLGPEHDLGRNTTLALDMMHADFDLITNLLGQPGTLQVTSTGGRMAAARRQGPPWILSSVRVMHQLIADAPALRRARRLARHLPRRRVRMRHEHRVHRPALELTLDVLQRLKQARR